MLPGVLLTVFRIVSNLRSSFPPPCEELFSLLALHDCSWSPRQTISGVLPACGGFLPEPHISPPLLLTLSPTTISSTQADPGLFADIFFGVQIPHSFQDAVTRVTSYCKSPQGLKPFIVYGPLYKNDFADSFSLFSLYWW